MYPVIHIGPAALQSSALAFLLALWLGAWFFERECERRGVSGEEAWNLMGIAVAVTVIAGRLAYAADNWSLFAADPAQFVALTPDSVSPATGILFGILAALAYVQRRQLDILLLLDALAPGALLAIALIAIGQFLSGDAYGIPSDSPWAVMLWGATREPVQLYDAALALTGAAFLWRRRQVARWAGETALLAVAWYGGARVLIDAFRGDATVLGDGYRATQVEALAVLLAALWLLMRLRNRDKVPASGETPRQS